MFRSPNKHERTTKGVHVSGKEEYMIEAKKMH